MKKIIAATVAIGLSVMFGVSSQAQLPPGFKKQELTKIWERFIRPGTCSTGRGSWSRMKA